jgi:RNA polymerase sporulation-specific sigma factor
MKKIKLGDKQARDKFAMGNMRLVLSVVQRFKSKGVSDDVFQVGCVGLMKAIDNFDMSVGVKFSTYAVPMIVGEIKRFMRDNNSIRVSRNLRDIAYNLLKAREELSKNDDSDISLDVLADYIGADVRDVAVALEAISDPLSLSDPVYSDGDDTIYLADQVGNPDNEEHWMENINLKKALDKLSDREKEIVNLRYFQSKTQMEVSEEVGISQAQVSRLEKNAIDSIKKNIT